MNKQTKSLKKEGYCSCNGGASTETKKVVHGSWSFQQPYDAISRKKNAGSSSWKVTKRHQSNQEILKRQEALYGKHVVAGWNKIHYNLL